MLTNMTPIQPGQPLFRREPEKNQNDSDERGDFGDLHGGNLQLANELTSGKTECGLNIQRRTPRHAKITPVGR
jgi:hypothetical protein